MNILTFDIEDWFHLLDLEQTKSEKEWSGFESRLENGTYRILEFLGTRNQKATFFILGWVADKYPHVVKKINDLGHEIGTHSHLHQLAYEQSKKEFTEDLRTSISSIENLIGKKVSIYRAPGFSIKPENKWAFEVLLENGIETDCSVFPAHRAHGGFEKFRPAQPCILDFGGDSIKEFPINLKYNKLVYSGGGYFRFFPRFLLDNWLKNDDYCMTYFHPRDFDAQQPILPNLSFMRRFKAYHGIEHCQNKLEHWLDAFTWVSLGQATTQIDWQTVPKVLYEEL